MGRTTGTDVARQYTCNVMHVRLLRKDNGRKSLEFATELMT
jgi:hypothetical protein